MTALQILGGIVLALPFIALFVFSVREWGWGFTVGVFAAVAVVIGVVTLGAALLTGDLGGAR